MPALNPPGPPARRRTLSARGVIFLTLSLAAGAAFAEFSLTDTAGKTHTLAANKGKWLLVNFWATWCPPCLDEIPDFAALYEARKNRDLMVIGVAVEYQKPDEVKRFAEDLLMTYPLVLGGEGVSGQFGNVSVLPVSFLYDPSGKLALKRIGPLSKQELERYLERGAGP
jgi:thiol-disulfide isomerase/thioredoxin